jgi:hypothetical protein
MRKLISAIVALGLACGVPTVIAFQAPQSNPPGKEQKPAPKAEEKAAASIAGKWTMSLETPNGTMTPALDLKQDGKKVSGTLASPQGETPLAGEFAEGKLTFNVSFQGNNGQVDLAFVASLKPDGTLAGTMNFSQGEMPWTAARVKEK